jgi:hypothetical protein
MGVEEEVGFANEVGRQFARNYGVPPITGCVLGWLLVCDPPQQTAAELSVALGASRSAIGSAVSVLEDLSFVQRTRVARERSELIALHPAIWVHLIEKQQEYAELAAMARRGLEVLGDVAPCRRARLLETAAFAEFLLGRMPRLSAEWRAHRDALRASGDLP